MHNQKAQYECRHNRKQDEPHCMQESMSPHFSDLTLQ